MRASASAERSCSLEEVAVEPFDLSGRRVLVAESGAIRAEVLHYYITAWGGRSGRRTSGVNRPVLMSRSLTSAPASMPSSSRSQSC